MKTYQFIFRCFFCLILLGFGCKKLEEGGYKPRSSRAIEATWGIHLFLQNNNDFTRLFRDSCACNLIIGNGYSDEGLEFFFSNNRAGGNIGNGEYNLINERAVLELKTLHAPSNHCIPFIENMLTQWKIKRYTNYNFWLEYNDGNSVYYLELIKTSNDN